MARQGSRDWHRKNFINQTLSYANSVCQCKTKVFDTEKEEEIPSTFNKKFSYREVFVLMHLFFTPAWPISHLCEDEIPVRYVPKAYLRLEKCTELQLKLIWLWISVVFFFFLAFKFKLQVCPNLKLFQIQECWILYMGMLILFIFFPDIVDTLQLLTDKVITIN